MGYMYRYELLLYDEKKKSNSELIVDPNKNVLSDVY